MPRRYSESNRPPVQVTPSSIEDERIPEATGPAEDVPQDDRPNLPTHVVRLGYNVSVSRLYMGADQRWHSTASFGLKDLLPLAKACDQAHTWISDQITAETPF